MNAAKDLIAQVAERSGRTLADVESVFIARGIDRTPRRRRATTRNIKILRLRLTGDRRGNIAPGPFDRTFEFSDGVNAIVAPNLAGKSTVLQCIDLLLSGRSVNLQSDVRLWLHTVTLDIEVNGRMMGMRVLFDPDSEAITRGVIGLGSAAALASWVDAGAPTPSGIELVADTESGEEWEHAVAATMLTELGLDEVVVFTANEDAGRLNHHGWPSYYSTVHPPAGSNEILIGPTAIGGLAPRLLQIFLDLPSAALRTRVHATVLAIEAERSSDERRRDATATGLSARRAAALRRLEQAEAALALLAGLAPTDDLTAVADLAAAASVAYADAQGRAATASAAFEQAGQERAADQRAVYMLRESIAAGRIFHGLSPAACPRCETTITVARRQQELSVHSCAVCTEPLPKPDDAEDEEELQQAEDALAASEEAVAALGDASARAQADVQRAKSELDGLDVRLRSANAARSAIDRVAAETEFAVARGAVEALGENEGEVPEPLELVVLRAAEKQLDQDYETASRAVFDHLSEELTRLATVFGIAETDKIVVKRNATMDVFKGGAPRSAFRRQSPGERLRLRYALLVALLRVAAAHNVAGHPGLLLLDSFKAEEVQDEDARRLLAGLVEIAEQVPNLQVIATTADDHLVATVDGVKTTITPADGERVLF